MAFEFIATGEPKYPGLPPRKAKESAVIRKDGIKILSDEAHERLEIHREFIREKNGNGGKVMTFDCYNAINDNGERVCCTKGHRLSNQSKDGSVSIEQILRGTFLVACQKCGDFNGD